jgi:hypothetical protein
MMKHHVPAMAILASLLAGAASASTVYDFTTLGTTSQASLTIDNFTITPSATGIANGGADVLTTSSAGLGVAGLSAGLPDFGAGDGYLIDGKPSGSTESITFTFDYAVDLDAFTLSAFDDNDDFSYQINGGTIVDGMTDFNAISATNVTSFTIFAQGKFLTDGIGNDEFGLASIEISSIPVPAAGGLLLAGLGALAFAARRRKSA